MRFVAQCVTQQRGALVIYHSLDAVHLFGRTGWVGADLFCLSALAVISGSLGGWGVKIDACWVSACLCAQGFLSCLKGCALSDRMECFSCFASRCVGGWKRSGIWSTANFLHFAIARVCIVAAQFLQSRGYFYWICCMKIDQNKMSGPESWQTLDDVQWVLEIMLAPLSQSSF